MEIADQILEKYQVTKRVVPMITNFKIGQMPKHVYSSEVQNVFNFRLETLIGNITKKFTNPISKNSAENNL